MFRSRRIKPSQSLNYNEHLECFLLRWRMLDPEIAVCGLMVCDDYSEKWVRNFVPLFGMAGYFSVVPIWKRRMMTVENLRTDA